MRTLLLCSLAALAGGTDPTIVHGVTISCQSDGREWASPAFALELDELASIGANWVAIHPYGRIGDDGEVRWRAFDAEHPPAHVASPIRAAHARGFAILVTPHLAQWGSRFRERSDIAFDDPAQRARFWESYTRWTVALAGAARDADAFSIGSEIDRMAGDEAQWRALIAQVRAATQAKLVYCANWSDFEQVPFWDALDAVGVQAYFPLCDKPEPADADLAAGWRAAIERMRAVHARTGKPVVLTELGYNDSLDAARTPWAYARAPKADRERAAALQARCLATALAAIDAEREWLRGAFLWKWFVGSARGENFLMKEPGPRAVIAKAWK